MQHVAQQGVEIVGPAGGDDARADGVFQDEVPADDPGDELAERCISVGIGTAGHRHHAGELGIAKRGESAADGRQQEREHQRRARRSPWRQPRSGRRARCRSSPRCRGRSGPAAPAADGAARPNSSRRSTGRHSSAGTGWTKTISSGFPRASSSANGVSSEHSMDSPSRRLRIVRRRGQTESAEPTDYGKNRAERKLRPCVKSAAGDQPRLFGTSDCHVAHAIPYNRRVRLRSRRTHAPRLGRCPEGELR